MIAKQRYTKSEACIDHIIANSMNRLHTAICNRYIEKVISANHRVNTEEESWTSYLAYTPSIYSTMDHCKPHCKTTGIRANILFIRVIGKLLHITLLGALRLKSLRYEQAHRRPIGIRSKWDERLDVIRTRCSMIGNMFTRIRALEDSMHGGWVLMS